MKQFWETLLKFSKANLTLSFVYRNVKEQKYFSNSICLKISPSYSNFLLPENNALPPAEVNV